MKTVGLILATLGASFMLSLSAFAIILAGSGVQDSDLILVVSYPWGPHASDVIAQSGLSETYPIRAPLGGLTVINTPQDLQYLRESGAWFLLDGKRVANLCSPKV